LQCEQDDINNSDLASAVIKRAQVIAFLKFHLTPWQTVAECVVFAREMANDRADAINPKTLEFLATRVSQAHKLKVS